MGGILGQGEPMIGSPWVQLPGVPECFAPPLFSKGIPLETV